MARTVLLLLTILALAACRSPAPPASDGKDVWQLYFLAGQSNMDGYGYVAELPAEAMGTIENVMIFTGQTTPDEQPAAGTGLWAPLRAGHGTGFRSDGRTNVLSSRFGPELLFGQTMAALQPKQKLALIKYSMGGTALAHGAGYGNWDPDSRDGHIINQYDHALATIRNALAIPDIDGNGTTDVLKPAGIVWMQGEADAHNSIRTAEAYGDNLKRMMDLLRAALHTDDLPVVIGRITDSGMNEGGQLMPFIETVQQAQADFARKDPCAALVTVTDSLGYLDDGWHYDTPGYIRLGTAFAEAMHGLRQTCAP